WVVVVEVHPYGRRWRGRRGEAAGERIGRRRSGADAYHAHVQHAFVLRRIGVTSLHHIIAPGEVSVELAPRSGSARDHQPPVPVVRESEKEAPLAGGIAGDARLDLESRHWTPNRIEPGGRIVRVGGRDLAAIGARRPSAGG